MNTYQIEKISSLTQEMLEQIVSGYSSDKLFNVSRADSGNQITFTLSLEKLDQPFFKKHDYADSSILEHYNSVAALGQSYGAFSESQCVGFILAEVQMWNSTLVVREFGVRPEMRSHGIGKSLIGHAIKEAKLTNLRSIFCETQNTNVDAIEFYRNQGFKIDGLDFSFYQNEDQHKREVAVFLRKDLPYER